MRFKIVVNGSFRTISPNNRNQTELIYYSLSTGHFQRELGDGRTGELVLSEWLYNNSKECVAMMVQCNENRWT